MKEEKKESKLKKVVKTTLGLVLVAGVGYLAYKKIPSLKKVVDSVVKSTPKEVVEEVVEEKPNLNFRCNRHPRRYETYNRNCNCQG